MKLFSKYNRILLLILMAGLLAVGILFYQALSFFLNAKIDENLSEELLEVRDYMHIKNITPAPSDDPNLVIEYLPVKKASGRQIAGDTTFYNPRKRQREYARFLKTDIVIGDRPLQVLILNSKSAQYRQVQLIFLVIILPVIILCGLLALINRYLLLRLWAPFNRILQQIQEFNLNKANYSNTNTDIIEFQQLNTAVRQMTMRIEDDFKEIKLFTENASHEMMTPIAIINSKLDILLQSERLAEEDSEALRDLYKATTRLNKINQSLLLLVKIDHNLLGDREWLSLDGLIRQKAESFQELITERQLRVSVMADDTSVCANSVLLDILLNNLFSNAIRHNIRQGNISISVKKGVLCFENSGFGEALPQNQVFERFYKGSHADGIGLGLAILKQICTKEGFALRYYFERGVHGFEIKFN